LDLLRIFRAGVAAVDPKKLVVDHFRTLGGRDGAVGPLLRSVRRSAKLTVIGAGKGAAAMAAGCEEELGADHVYGLVIAPDGYSRALDAIEVAVASHPVPDDRAVEATEKICRLLQRENRGPVLCLLSGGASSLLVRPIPPVTLEDKRTVTRRLLESGADIRSLNAVRKHLSGVKGGGLLRLTAQRPFSTLILSDVIGDDPSVIGSGPTTPDSSTFADAEAVLDRGMAGSVPDSVRYLLARGRNGEVRETVKPGDPETSQTYNTVIGSNRTAVSSAAAEAKRLGYGTIVREVPLAGATSDAALDWYEEMQGELRSRPPGRYCLLAGGETVVHVRGAGRGGRNQEFALGLVSMIADTRLAILSAGTDGIDGPTDAAGAFVDGTSAHRAKASGMEARAFLHANDSYTFFHRLGDLFVCGPTGTNVMDLKIAVVSTEPANS
jgi:hydroxypyruvate reductase